MDSNKSDEMLLGRGSMQKYGHPHYWLKWTVISILIGIVTGVGAITFYTAMHLVTGLVLGTVVGYLPPNAAGEGATHIIFFWAATHPWLLPVVTTLGGLVAGIIVCCLAPEAEGGGQDAAIAAFHQGTSIRARVPFVKLVASAIIIGTGGSAGREGPIAHISAGLGSILARILHLDMQDQRIALATGMGAGIGAIFRAPLGGAILAAEILYQGDLEVEILIPSLIASTVGYSIFGLWYGWNPIFATPTSLVFISPPQLLYYSILGTLCGLLGRLYALGFSTIKGLFHRLPVPEWIKPAMGGLIVGLVGLAMPQVLGASFGWIQISMGLGLLTLPLGMLLLLPFAKILTTCLSIGSGGSGGIFGPGIVIGGITGALLWRLGYHLLPGLPAQPAPFVIVGMMALFGAIAHAPIAMMLMVAEMTGNLAMLAPAMIAVSLSSLLVGKQSIFINQPEKRTGSSARQLHSTFLRHLTVAVRLVTAVVRGFQKP
jgi:CIC family chloride channel protein